MHSLESVIYLIRHAESVYVEGQERSRGLTAAGLADAAALCNRLKTAAIEQFFSSPYERAIQTIRPLADSCSLDITLVEDLRERAMGEFSPLSFIEAKRRVYEYVQFSFPNGESSVEAQSRIVEAVCQILKRHEGKTIVIGTHGDIMTLFLNYFDPGYGFECWQSTTMPDIYRVRWQGQKIINVEGLWNN
ncbi:histidine phosphatase family protein [Paenibacillus chartarius]|uniref:Histidine phosphatase family protein n=1 Tax=Paenibacillus chartarius TaxID=747481 RepID=A0ABV6DND2_9BACL